MPHHRRTADHPRMRSSCAIDLDRRASLRSRAAHNPATVRRGSNTGVLMRSRRWVTLAVTTALVVSGAPRPATAAATTTKVMIVGDSISQGSAGDFTWRYRLWKHLAPRVTGLDFVGPRTDLFDN